MEIRSVSDKLKCQAEVVAYKSLDHIKMGQFIFSLAYGNCKDFLHVLRVLFT